MNKNKTMQSITDILQQRKEKLTRPALSPSSSVVSNQIIASYGSREKFLMAFNPDTQRSMAADTDKCFFENFPTLSQINATYSRQTAEAWLVPQLYDLSNYCGARDKLQGRPLEQCAEVIAQEFHYLKVSELMLFFHRFKSGRYGRFYGTVDPLIIVTALRDFCQERGQAYDQHEQQLRQQRDEEYRSRAITYEEYQARKQQREKTKS